MIVKMRNIIIIIIIIIINIIIIIIIIILSIRFLTIVNILKEKEAYIIASFRLGLNKANA